MTGELPGDAITAATTAAAAGLRAMWTHSRSAEDHDDFIAECCVAAALEAAAPVIAAEATRTERERIRQLVDIQKRTYESNVEAWSDIAAAALKDLADVLDGPQ